MIRTGGDLRECLAKPTHFQHGIVEAPSFNEICLRSHSSLQVILWLQPASPFQFSSCDSTWLCWRLLRLFDQTAQVLLAQSLPLWNDCLRSGGNAYTAGVKLSNSGWILKILAIAFLTKSHLHMEYRSA
jgi:hypothetical protein